jgi:uncharacterized membrane protein YoaK (UPF0700 family)
MNRYAKRVRLFAAGLSGLAGFVDAIGFISLGGFFVSFMSGNTTRLGVGAAGDAHAVLLATGLVALFVTGVMAGTLVRRVTPWRHGASVLLLVSVLLALAALAGMAGAGPPAAAVMALAMGAENAVFERDGEVHIGLTYMTGTLVKLGQHLTAAMLGGPPLAWLSYLLLWLGLAGGAAMGALVYPVLGLAALWLASAAALAFAAMASVLLP